MFLNLCLTTKKNTRIIFLKTFSYGLFADNTHENIWKYNSWVLHLNQQEEFFEKKKDIPH